MRLRLRLPGGSNLEALDVDEATMWVEFLYNVEGRSNIAKERLRILVGRPPQVVTAADTDLVGSLFRNGDILFVQDGEATVVRGVTNGRYITPAEDNWHFVRRVCPSDGSCLFHAAAYVLRDKSRTDGLKLREDCADTVLANPDYFTQSLLERPYREYAEWIRRPTSWGGAIELVILSFTTQTEIIALNLEWGRMERFGEDKGYTVCAFLVYKGQHYDALAMNQTYNSSRESEDRVLFSVSDKKVIDKAWSFLKEEAASMTR
ncbi:ubiquitin thioesterase OTU1 [Trypanosoma conorhini]|uniref:Ubiquitin thioesterase OTU n=1 Tax=Trypanosoma conorhini TaxID=83891 RepID=A0A422Q7Q3_9TRYP|nr:ubiquitin thioesterase OTU1 [Trypanosoma conorhini]RNF25998.1 ubiquitin thioesterase OTU1 [Trypanosoma conorhini]